MGARAEEQADHYFFVWNVTDEGLRNIEALKDTIRRASAMVDVLRGRCRLYVTIGGPYDMIGVAEGINDAQAAELLLAVNALRTIRTTAFFKARNFSLDQYDSFVNETAGLLKGRL